MLFWEIIYVCSVTKNPMNKIYGKKYRALSVTACGEYTKIPHLM
jgi:hypothetical protein